ncbi:hypothetical protein N1029_15825 [Herbiconiux sp. CPCC 203406]|uniref:hypothetical protein n=1 Tax=Herbiconiux oxytropis TaxID=2970915 RepID=UPI00217CE8FE|nr:hypothetical protein [Herbiconiux oxytropis]MCS5723468.1 hypothetical protein [Herbiconiux oxytropis]
MIVEVGLSPRTLVEISAQLRGPSSKTLNHSLWNALRAHGSIVFATREDVSAVAALARDESLSPTEQRNWQAVLAQLRSEGRIRIANPALVCNIDAISTADQVKGLRGSLPLLAVFANETFRRLFPQDVEGVATSNAGFEAATGETASISSSIQHVEALAATERFARGTARNDVWSKLFLPLARTSKTVTIFDRYIFSELWKRHQSREPAAEHIEWFLTKLDAVAPKNTTVTIYGAADFDYQPRAIDSIAAVLGKRWSPKRTGRVVEVDLRALPRWGRGDPHNRHLRFGDMVGYELPEGMDRLQSPSLEIGEGFTFGYKWRPEQIASFRDREAAVDGARSRVSNSLLYEPHRNTPA